MLSLLISDADWVRSFTACCGCRGLQDLGQHEPAILLGLNILIVELWIVVFDQRHRNREDFFGKARTDVARLETELVGQRNSIARRDQLPRQPQALQVLLELLAERDVALVATEEDADQDGALDVFEQPLVDQSLEGEKPGQRLWPREYRGSPGASSLGSRVLEIAVQAARASGGQGVAESAVQRFVALDGGLEQVAFFENGNPAERSTYADGKQNGPHLVYFDDGKTRSTMTFVNGVADGPFVAYNADGKKDQEGTYAKGMQEGSWREYNADGSIMIEMLYAKGQLVKDRKENGTFKESLDKERAIGRQQRETFRSALKAGVKMVYGTDAGVYPNGDNARQFAKMVEWGMTPLQAIQAATVNAAQALGRDRDVGAIEAGRYGDLIAVTGDPLKDVGVLTQVGFVMKGGDVVKSAH